MNIAKVVRFAIKNRKLIGEVIKLIPAAQIISKRPQLRNEIEAVREVLKEENIGLTAGLKDNVIDLGVQFGVSQLKNLIKK